MSQFESHLIKSLGEFQLYEKQWNELYTNSSQHLAIGRHALVRAFWQHFHAGKSVEVACVIDSDSGQLAAAMPMVKRSLARILPIGATLSNPWCFGLAGLCSNRYNTTETIDHLLRSVEMGGYQMLALDLVSNENPFVKTIQAGVGPGHWETRTVPLFSVGKTLLAPSWEEFTHDWSKKRRRFIRRATDQLSQLGDLNLKRLHQAPWGEVLAGWTVCQEIEQAGWKGQAGTSLADNPAALGFYAELLKQLHDSGELRLYLLELGGRVIAYDLGYLHHNAATSLKVSYHPEFAASSPGHVLNSLVVQDLIAGQEATWIDTVGEWNEANAKWCRARYECQNVEVSLRGWSSRSLVRSRDWLRTWKRRWLDTPRISGASDPDSTTKTSLSNADEEA